MRWTNFILILNVVAAVRYVPAYAQNTTGTTAGTNPQPDPPSIQQTVKDFDKLMSNSEQLHRSSLPSSRTPKSITPVLLAIPEFRKATADLREAVGAKQSTRVPLESIEKLIKPFAEYFKDLKLKSAAPDVQELRSYTQKDLLWETLTTAERIDNNLQIANRLLRASNQSGAVTIKTMQFYGEIDSDLKRLKWLADRVETQR